MDLTTNYLGLTLKNPLIVGSSGLTGTVEGVKKISEKGASAVVLKSLFQEEILFESDDVIAKMKKEDPNVKYFDYDGKKNPIEFYGYKVREDNLNRYTALISGCKEAVHIPVIASVNCFYDSLEWVSFTRQIEAAGADALELNMFFPPSDFSEAKADKEAIYFKTIETITKQVSIPVSLKISHYFTNLGPMIKKLSETDVKGLVLFNRFFSPDFDLKTLEVKPSFVFSNPSELAMSMRWIAIMSSRVSCDLAASTGVHDHESLIKQILAGADAVQVASTLYKNGVKHIIPMIEGLKSWMTTHNFKSISDFKGKLSQAESENPSLFERSQFMKYFAGKKNVIT